MASMETAALYKQAVIFYVGNIVIIDDEKPLIFRYFFKVFSISSRVKGFMWKKRGETY